MLFQRCTGTFSLKEHFNPNSTLRVPVSLSAVSELKGMIQVNSMLHEIQLSRRDFLSLFTTAYIVGIELVVVGNKKIVVHGPSNLSSTIPFAYTADNLFVHSLFSSCLSYCKVPTTRSCNRMLHIGYVLGSRLAL